MPRKSSMISESSQNDNARHIWTTVEDNILRSCVKEQLENTESNANRGARLNWKLISDDFTELFNNNKIPYMRSGKQCRERWRNHVGVEEEKSWDTEKDDFMLYHLNSIYLNKWTTIANLMGKTENDVKNRFHVSIRKKIFDICELLQIKKDPKTIYSLVIKEKIPYNLITESLISNLANTLNQGKIDKKKLTQTLAKIDKENKANNQIKDSFFLGKKTNNSITLNYNTSKNKREAAVKEEEVKKKEDFPYIVKFKKFCLEFNNKKDYKL